MKEPRRALKEKPWKRRNRENRMRKEEEIEKKRKLIPLFFLLKSYAYSVGCSSG
jgi:hypothetical protein